MSAMQFRRTTGSGWNNLADGMCLSKVQALFDADKTMKQLDLHYSDHISSWRRQPDPVRYEMRFTGQSNLWRDWLYPHDDAYDMTNLSPITEVIVTALEGGVTSVAVSGAEYRKKRASS